MISSYKYNNFVALDIQSEIFDNSCIHIIIDNEHFKNQNILKYSGNIQRIIYHTCE